ncbi:ATP F0F1 synthase subunit I [Sesbania bispinosa]|nr:ATP F0F1 synthase subunit I [Sesbania bispinosa]
MVSLHPDKGGDVTFNECRVVMHTLLLEITASPSAIFGLTICYNNNALFVCVKTRTGGARAKEKKEMSVTIEEEEG